MNSALLSSKKMDWCTPQDFFDHLNEEFGFVLDAAATDKTAKCPLYYTPETDGLSQSWDRGGAVFCNPPYGREIGKWVKKAYEEARGGGGTLLYCLFPLERIQPIFTITYNYAKHYYRVFGEKGIRTIYGMTGAESIPIIKAAMAQLGDDVSTDYWEDTEGNAKKALAGLLAFAQMRPDGVWDGD